MTLPPLRRAYPLVLTFLAILLGIVNLWLRSPAHSGTPAPTAHHGAGEFSAGATTGQIDQWLSRYEASSSSEQPRLLREGIRLAQARQRNVLELMQRNPRAALAQAPSHAELAALPSEVSSLMERRISGIGSIDLRWRTNVTDDGRHQCRHEHVLYLNGQTWEAYGPALEHPVPPLSKIPVSGIALGKRAVLAPSAVEIISDEDLPAARTRFRDADGGRQDPLTQREVNPATATTALIGGSLYQFEYPDLVEEVAAGIQRAIDASIASNRTQFESPYPWLAANDEGDQGEQPLAPTPWTDDHMDLLFIRVDFPDLFGGDTFEELTTTFESVRGNVEMNSFGSATVDFTITPTIYRLPNTAVSYATSGDTEGLHADASALAAMDYNLDDYDVVAVYFRTLKNHANSLITFGGLATIGGRKQWINGKQNVNTILHECGHNYGLYHANYWDPDEKLSGDYEVPSSLEYGDIFDVMGEGDAPEGHFNQYAKHRLGWLPDSKVAEVSVDTTVRLFRFDHQNATSNPTLALKVPVGGAVDYWVGYRQLYTSTSFNLHEGATIIASGLSQGGESNLIDATPNSRPSESGDRKDCALEVGVPFNESGISFEALARGGTSPNEWIDVRVTFANRVGLTATNFEVDEQAGTAEITFQRQFSTSGFVSVDYSTSDGSATSPADYFTTSGTVTWEDGDDSNKTVILPIRPDAFSEDQESFTLTLSNPTGASLDAHANSATISILDASERSPHFNPGFFNNAVYATVPLPDGKVLIGGNINHTTGDFASIYNFARLNPDGTVDSTFDTGSGFDDLVRAVVVQSDGKIIVGGDFNSYRGVACNGLIRLDPDGTIDTNIGGIDNGTVHCLAIEDNGKILVGGDFSSFSGYNTEGMVRLTTAGVRDTSNSLILPFNTSFTTAIHSLTVLDNDRIMATGSFYISGLPGGFRSGVARLWPSGLRDSSFNPGGGAHASGNPNQIAPVYGLTVMPDGKYVIGGFMTAYDGNNTPYIARIRSNGSFDSTFNPPSLPYVVYSVQSQPDGKVIAGLISNPAETHLVRLNENGSSDGSFDVGTGPAGSVLDLALTPSGHLFVGGNYFQFDGASARPITRLVAGIDPYLYWRNDTFTQAQINAGSADPDANPDGDNWSNAAERALGTDPLVADVRKTVREFGDDEAVSLVMDDGESYLQATIAKTNGSAVWFTAQFSADHHGWEPSPSQPGDASNYDVIEDSSTRFTVRDKTPLGNGSRFVRFGIQSPN